MGGREPLRPNRTGLFSLLLIGLLFWSLFFANGQSGLLISACAVLGTVGLRSEAARPGPVVSVLVIAGLVGLCVAILIQLVRLPGSKPISIAPDATGTALLLFVALALLFLGATRRFSERGPTLAVQGLFILGVLVAAASMMARAAWVQTLFGFQRPSGFGWPFANVNHLAGWMLMAIPPSLGYFRSLVDSNGYGGAASRIWPVGIGIFVMALSVAMTMSRAGLGCLLLTLVIMASARKSPGRRYTTFVVCLIVLMSVAIAVAGAPAIVQRFGALRGSEYGGRLDIWKGALCIIRASPVTGTGLHTYDVAVRACLGRGMPAYFGKAHNDYLQLAAEGGLLLGVPALILLVVSAKEIGTRFRKGADDQKTRWIRLGSVAGLVGIAAQETVDFSLQIPPNAILFTVLLAIAMHRHGAAQGPRPR